MITVIKLAPVIAQPFILLISGNKTDDKLESEVDNLYTGYYGEACQESQGTTWNQIFSILIQI